MHLAVILVIVLIVFGPGKLTNLGGQLGKGLRDFRTTVEKDPPPTGRATVFCPKCGHPRAAADAQFCSECGGPLPASG